MNEQIVFKEWAPDQPDLGAEVLIKAQNVIPRNGWYEPFLPLDTSLGTVPAAVNGAIAVVGATKGAQRVIAVGGTTYYEGLTAFTARGAASSVSSTEQFAQFDELVIGVGVGHIPMAHLIGASSSFSALSASAPGAGVIGIVNRFVVLGDLLDTAGTQRSNSIQWSGIDQPTSWPLPNSTTATAQQSGEQEMPLALGAVQAVHGGDQYAVVLQHNGVSRMTYAGPPVVFQFDVIDKSQGSFFRNGSIQVGRIVYFISPKGFCRTDGVSVERLGNAKVDKFFWDNYRNAFGGVFSVRSGYDPINELIYWGFIATLSGTDIDTVIIYDPNANRFAYAGQSLSHFVTPASAFGQEAKKLLAFGTGSTAILGEFAGTAGSATIETSDAEFNPGGRSYIDGIKPNVESSATAPAIGVRIGFRDSLDTAPSYTSTANANAATGFANFRVDAKYARAEITIAGAFDKITGMVASADPSSER